MSNPQTKILLSIPEAATAIGMCRSKVYQLMDGGELESIKIGKRRLIPADALHDWVESLRGHKAAA